MEDGGVAIGRARNSSEHSEVTHLKVKIPEAELRARSGALSMQAEHLIALGSDS